MRELNVSLIKRSTKVVAIDERGFGNANHVYKVYKTEIDKEAKSDGLGLIEFQDGPIKETGVNGIADIDLIAICVDRLEGFQSGDYKCDTNQTALQHLLDAITTLNKRTKDRENRGVEGTSKM